MTKLLIAQTGRYKDLEDPYTQGLKKDAMYRNMSLNTFNDLHIMILKKISQKFRLEAEEMFIEALSSQSEVCEYLENQEISLMIKAVIEQLQ